MWLKTLGNFGPEQSGLVWSIWKKLWGKKVISRSGNGQRKIYFFKSKNFIMSQEKLKF